MYHLELSSDPRPADLEEETENTLSDINTHIHKQGVNKTEVKGVVQSGVLF